MCNCFSNTAIDKNQPLENRISDRAVFSANKYTYSVIADAGEKAIAILAFIRFKLVKNLPDYV